MLHFITFQFIYKFMVKSYLKSWYHCSMALQPRSLQPTCDAAAGCDWSSSYCYSRECILGLPTCMPGLKRQVSITMEFASWTISGSPVPSSLTFLIMVKKVEHQAAKVLLGHRQIGSLDWLKWTRGGCSFLLLSKLFWLSCHGSHLEGLDVPYNTHFMAIQYEKQGI